jgi:hypothetical protein
MGQKQSVYEISASGTNALQAIASTTAGFSTFSGGLSLQYGPALSISGMTKAAQAVVTSNGHGFNVGDVVVFQDLYQSSTTGMPQICGMPFQIVAADTNTFTIPWNTNQSNYTALSTPASATVKKVLYPFLYAPGISIINAITTGSTTTVSTTAAHNLSVGAEVALRIPRQWGSIQLNSLPNSVVPGSPVYSYVKSVTDSRTVVLSLNSSSATAFNSNPPVTPIAGLSFPQLVAVGDINNGGSPYLGGDLYPSPMVNGLATVNGPGINSAFVNNSSQGFIMSKSLFDANDVIYWRALLHDYVSIQ